MRMIAFLLTLALPFSAMASEAPALSGSELFPENATEETAAYRFSYRYPQFEADVPCNEQINAYYQGLCQDTLSYSAPPEADVASEGEVPCYTELDYQVTACTSDYLSVLLTSRQLLGNGESESLAANVFALSGEYAGRIITLSQVLGVEQPEGEQASYTEEKISQLVWQIVEEQKALKQIDYLEGLVQEDLERSFHPETDFFINEEQNVVFFVQAGTIASEVEGVLQFPFSMAELLSALTSAS